MAALGPSTPTQHDQRNDVVVDEETPLLSPPTATALRRRRSSARRATFVDWGKRPQLLLRGLIGLLALLFVALLVLVFSYRGNAEDSRPPSKPPLPPLDDRGRLNPPNLLEGKHGAVAAENRQCSEIGTALLQKGGSAADAAVGATLCVGVLNMFSSGIGGGGFALIRAPAPEENPSQAGTEHVVIDFREQAPAAAFEEMFHGATEKAKFGGLAVGVPGELKGLEEIWRRWGKLEWEDLLQPSIQLAKEAKVGKELARRLGYFGGFMPEKKEWADIFLDAETGGFLKEGDTIRRPAYARTLEAIAQHGAQAFYEGEMAEAMVKKVQAAGGILTTEDLQDYRIEVRKAINGTWLDGRRVWTSPAPTSGPVLLGMMNLLRRLGIEEERHHEQHGSQGDKDAARRALWAHRLVEVFKHGYAARTRLGDPAYLNQSALAEIAQIPTQRRAYQLAKKVDDTRTFPIDHYAPLFDVPEDHGTTHISAVDSSGMAVGITSTVNLIFGSQVMDPETGVIFNDEMDDTSTPGTPNAFGLYPSPYNYPQPGKRPLSSMSPVVIEDAQGRFQVLLGAAGGSRIPTSVLSTLLNMDIKGMDLSQAIEAPRLHHQLLPDVVAVESTFDEYELDEGLRARGHQLKIDDINLGYASVQGVQARRDGKESQEVTYLASSDSRKAGWAAAY
ncbi:gamma-glutamyltranspeptidase [Jaminaea rosea]|uniref:Glutathione hydrolase n=1 Tax=Jaminaea rosea TaxID=1569628 RepID=A0A316V0R7_9BASI|nr:gamma-glutamyltranspeptidase [Jaminaea rosea]PWN29763.1 gamma-glutamyltranspeptidase [Jaminaea rosea]